MMNHTSYLSENYRPDLIRGGLYRREKDWCIYSEAEGKKRLYYQDIILQMFIYPTINEHLLGRCPETSTPIPIAPRSTLVTFYTSAVSSLEAYKTPAR